MSTQRIKTLIAFKATALLLCIAVSRPVEAGPSFLPLDDLAFTPGFHLGNAEGGIIKGVSEGRRVIQSNGFSLGFEVPFLSDKSSIFHTMSLKTGLAYNYIFAHNGKFDCNGQFVAETVVAAIVIVVAVVIVGALGGDTSNIDTSSIDVHSECRTPGEKTLTHQLNLPLGLQFRSPGWGPTVETGSIVARLESWPGCAGSAACPGQTGGLTAFDGSLYSRLGFGYNGPEGGIGAFMLFSRFNTVNWHYGSGPFESLQAGIEGYRRF